jgi:hypothetical protein
VAASTTFGFGVCFRHAGVERAGLSARDDAAVARQRETLTLIVDLHRAFRAACRATDQRRAGHAGDREHEYQAKRDVHA